MALAVDRFQFLVREISEFCGDIRDALAIIGTVYSAKKVLQVIHKLWIGIRTYGIPRFTNPDLVKKYGKWALITGSSHGIGKAFAQELAAHGFNIIIVSLGRRDCQTVAAMLVVTGCTSGIGQAYAIELAARGCNLILISRSENKLVKFATTIKEQFNVETHIIPVDFNEGAVVYDRIRAEIQGKEVGILMNNVGVMYDYPQMFLDVPDDKLWQLVNVNVAAATLMTKLVLPQMVERKKGAVITVASGASTMPTPEMGVYSATKAYLDYFTRALAYEYRNTGVTIQCLMPFYVATRMTAYSSTLSNPSLLIPTATTYARSALATLGWSPRTTGYWPHTIQYWFAALIPEWLWLWGATRLNMALRREANKRIRHRSGGGAGAGGSRHGSFSVPRSRTGSMQDIKKHA